jgi:hypothetical protein
MFIGDYIGLVATPTRVMAAYIQPSARPPALNQLLFSSFS